MANEEALKLLGQLRTLVQDASMEADDMREMMQLMYDLEKELLKG